MTREDWLIDKINKVAQEHIVPKILAHEKEYSKEETNRLTINAFMYSCGRISPLRYLMMLTRALPEEEYHQVDIELAREANETSHWIPSGNEKLKEAPNMLPEAETTAE